jgi:hypothetical protein
MTTLGNHKGARSPSGFKVAPQNYAKLETAAQLLRPKLPLVGVSGTYELSGWRILEKTLPQVDFHYRVAEKKELKECAGFTVPEKRLVVIRQDEPILNFV